jgi:hypothetical protein
MGGRKHTSDYDLSGLVQKLKALALRYRTPAATQSSILTTRLIFAVSRRSYRR